VDERLIEAWREAAADLDIRVVAPHELDGGPEAGTCEVFLPDFGSPRGALVVSAKTERRIRSTLRRSGQWVAIASAKEPRRYDRRRFVAELRDFRWFGTAEERPQWLD
jgi:hypothetical protein